MPIARIRCKKAGPYEVSRSRTRYRGARSHGNSSVTWRAIHSAVGFAVPPNDTQSRRPCRTNDKTIQNLEGDRRQDKEVDRRDAVGVIAEKRPPALRRWPRAAAHVPSDRRLGDLEAELEQLTMNTWRAPKCVRTAHLANERAQLSRDPRSANTVAGSPAPIRPKPSTVPANDGLRPDDRNHLKVQRQSGIPAPICTPPTQRPGGLSAMKSVSPFSTARPRSVMLSMSVHGGL